MNYSDMQKSDNGIPTWNSFLPVVLEVIQHKNIWTRKELEKAAVDSIQGLPTEIRQRKYETNNGNIIEHRAAFSVSLLKNAGLIDYPKRNTYAPNEQGMELLDRHGSTLTQTDVKDQPAYKRHEQLLFERKNARGAANSSTVEINQKDSLELLTPEAITNEIERLTESINDGVAIELLERILENDSDFFEHLVVKLLIAMGYSGEKGHGWVTQRSNDGGIDGIINQDPLGTQTVYVQAKRMALGNTIGRPEIQRFNGALIDAHGNKGVFITTSSFTSNAEESARTSGIVLIDGATLADLMLKHKVGIRVRDEFEILDIDEDFFSDY